MGIAIRRMTMRDYPEAVRLWESTEGVAVSEDDSREAIRSFLRRNCGMSFVARDGGELVGAVPCGHDGRRGCLRHLAVAPSQRRKGLGRALVDRCMAGLRAAGIRKCYVFVLSQNRQGRAFWQALGWAATPQVTPMATTTRGGD